MSKERFIDNISDEALVKITDKMLNYEKTAKTRNIKANLFKIIPAVAAIVLIIGLINLLPLLSNVNGDIDENDGTPGAHAETTVDDYSMYIDYSYYNDQNIYEAALRLYFGLLPDEEITREQLAEITEMSIIRGLKTDGLMAENIHFND